MKYCHTKHYRKHHSFNKLDSKTIKAKTIESFEKFKLKFEKFTQLINQDSKITTKIKIEDIGGPILLQSSKFEMIENLPDNETVRSYEPSSVYSSWDNKQKYITI
ncbi:unnamed protein product [Candida verbasci]|uniref:Uncharacterized protein n=1 Tax=Candida verbasci TaxID=1227364 RepID=A0A9W4XG80_9ASCO|nr:unnamed protein product [Candida verbasci]